MAINISTYNKEQWFQITNHDQLRPFFMSIVSDANHWMFISSNGGLTAGRKNAQYALFPYYTDDKLTEQADVTGSKTIVKVLHEGSWQLWEPFSERFTGKYQISRNLYKHFRGNKIMFEEINHDLGLIFRYQWNTGKQFGFIKQSEIVDTTGAPRQLKVLDGLQNIMPHGVAAETQTATSNLVDAYKRSELAKEAGVGVFALSAIIVDRAEPSEALKANVAWTLGLADAKYLLSSRQLNAFRQMQPIAQEVDIKGERGAYFVHAELTLEGKAAKSWKLVANVNQTHAQVVALCQSILKEADLDQQIQDDIDDGAQTLDQLVASADGVQSTADTLKDRRHYANVLFNIMRGGIFDDGYQIEKADFLKYLTHANRPLATRQQKFLEGLPAAFERSFLVKALEKTTDKDLARLAKEYLPLKFSRRHGDPSRPWNKFSINTHNEQDGSKILDYEGNWRDIFQNWEALAHAFPDFMEGMIYKFLNSSTFDGYNPYRVTKGGFDWETIEPDNPWSYIGYWGDHQVIYLLKFLEIYAQHKPQTLPAMLGEQLFVYANVPYRIKPYDQIVENPKDTIIFNEEADRVIRKKMAVEGADGALLASQTEGIHRVSFMEKILAMLLAKISNYIPEAGIWLNTQRPEWNDANNALVGNGASMVTLYYLRRFLSFFEKVVSASALETVPVSEEVAQMFQAISAALANPETMPNGKTSDQRRRALTDALGKAGSDFRERIYEQGFSGATTTVDLAEVSEFLQTAKQHLGHSIGANQRPDRLYHAYNVVSFYDDGIAISHLDQMLEGQVAVISSGFLAANQVLEVLDAMRNSPLYREDQQSYLLYPNKQLPGFLQKNVIPKTHIDRSQLLQRLLADGNTQVLEQDVAGGYHFNGNFKNANDLQEALALLAEGPYAGLLAKEKKLVLEIFESVFNHKSFTGRSGTFFGYEGLGSIYWHMVSKLHLAVMETITAYLATQQSDEVAHRLIDHHYAIGQGIGVHKSPEQYGAFPTDPYSHTPQYKGAQQPGMTGQVKEDILVRLGELGVTVAEACLCFKPILLKKSEFLPDGTLAFTYCQLPITYKISQQSGLSVAYADGRLEQQKGNCLDAATSRKVFRRSGEIARIEVAIQGSSLI